MSGVDHHAVMTAIAEDSGWSLRFAFMILMSAGIAVLGLLVSSPAVVIGAMLISPLMNPILGFGFSLATFDFAEARRSLTALAIGAALAVAFSGIIVAWSPLKEATAEILGRTRPNLFDLFIALFAAMAGTFAIIKGRGGTIVGVAIATALMPPLSVVGYGLATRNFPVTTGALELFFTNFVTIALSATIVARFYGFGHALSGRQGWIQTVILTLVFAALAIPLGFSLSRIAQEAFTVTEVRRVLTSQFGPASRVTQLDVYFDTAPLVIRAVVIAPHSLPESRLQAVLQDKLRRSLDLQIGQLQLAPNSNSLDAQKTQLQTTPLDPTAAGHQQADRVAHAVALAAGVSPMEVVADPDHKRVTATAAPLAGADLSSYRALEQRVADAAPGWQVSITPPYEPLPLIRFANGSDVLDSAALKAVQTSSWAAKKWRASALRIPGLPRIAPPHARLSQRRALAIAKILNQSDLASVPAPAAGPSFRLALAAPAGQL